MAMARTKYHPWGVRLTEPASISSRPASRKGRRRSSSGRKVVDQVGIEGLEADLSGGVHQIAHPVEGLDAVDGLLHHRVEILHPEAQPVEAGLPQGRQPGAADRA